MKLPAVGIVLLLASVVVFWVAVEAHDKLSRYRAEADAIRRRGGDGSRYDTARTMQQLHRTDALM